MANRLIGGMPLRFNKEPKELPPVVALTQQFKDALARGDLKSAKALARILGLPPIFS